jgi:hypothetical protein
VSFGTRALCPLEAYRQWWKPPKPCGAGAGTVGVVGGAGVATTGGAVVVVGAGAVVVAGWGGGLAASGAGGGGVAGGGVPAVVVGTVAVVVVTGFVGLGALWTAGLASGVRVFGFAAGFEVAGVVGCAALAPAAFTAAVAVGAAAEWWTVRLGTIATEAICVAAAFVGRTCGFAAVVDLVEARCAGWNASGACTESGDVVSGTSSAVWPPEPRRCAGRSARTASAAANRPPAIR